MRLSKVSLILTSLISLTLTACVATSTTPTNPTPTPLASSPTPSVYFPVQKDIPRVVASGDIHGTLVLDNGGLRLKPDQGGESELIVWPYGFSLAFDKTRIQIVDSKGVISGIVGERLDLGGGGDYPRDYVEDTIGKPLPTEIKGPFWIASKVLPKPSAQTARRPAPIFLMQLEVQKTYHLSILSGQLQLGQNGGLRVSGALVLWPYGYSLREESGNILLLDSHANPICQVGDWITMGGGYVPKEEAALVVGVNNLADYFGPSYWLASDSVAKMTYHP